MGNENIDVIRLFDTEANLIAGSKMRPGMLAFATDTHRMVRKKLSDSTFAYWSDDSKQLLLAGAQIITGIKTSSGTHIFNGAVTINEILTLSKELILTPTLVSSITDGVTNLNPADTPHIRITKDDTNPVNNTVGILAGTAFGQLLLITCSDRSGIQIDDSVSSSALINVIIAGTSYTYLNLGPNQTALFVWAEGISGNDNWTLIATSGTGGP